MKNRQLKLGAVLSYAQMAVNIIIGLLYTPVMLRILGQSEYGLYNTVVSTISMLSVLSFGFNSSYIRYYSEYKTAQNQEKIDSLNGVFLMVFSIIGLVALVCGIYISYHLEYVFDQGLTPSEYETARIMMLALTVNLAISFPMSTFTSIISAHERYIFLKTVGVLRTVLSPVLTLPLLLMGFRSIAMVLVTILISVAVDILYVVYCRRLLAVRFRFSGMDKQLLKSLFQYSFFIAIHIIVDQINNNMDKFLLARFIDTQAVAVYTVGFMLYQYYMLFSVGISGVFSPTIHHIVNATRHCQTEQRNQLTSLFVRVGRIQFLLLGLIASGLIFFGNEFIGFWAGPDYKDSYYVALLLIIPATVPFIQNIGIEIQRAMNKHGAANLFYLGMAVLNLLVTIQLCQRYGVVGAAIGTAASFILANGLAINVYYHKVCNIDILIFWKSILNMFPGMILPVAVGVMMKKYIAIETIPVMLAGILAYTVVYGLSMWLIGINNEERELLASMLGKKRMKLY